MSFALTQKGLSSEAIAVLRDCHLSDQACVDGVYFVRCGRKLGIGQAYKIAQEIHNKLGDSNRAVFAAWNADLGLDDYVRVNRGSQAYSLICYMKS